MQPVSGVEPVRVQGTTASTTVIRDHPCVLQNITLAGSLDGTVSVYNSVSGTPSAGELVETFLENNPNSAPVTLNVGWELNKGCVVVATGSHEVVFGMA